MPKTAEELVQEEQQKQMDDLDYVPEEDAGTTVDDGGKEPEPEPEPGPEVKEEKVEEKPKEEKPVEEKPVSTEAELLDTYKKQVAHFQKLAEDRAKEVETLKKPVEESKPAATLTQEQIRTHYAPEIKRVVEEGYMSEEFVNSYPDEAAQFMFHRDMIYQLNQRVTQLVGWANTQLGTSKATEMDQKLFGLFDAVASQDEFYKPLSDPEVRKSFKEYLLTLNPFVDQLNEEFVGRQWIAFNREAILEAAKIAAGEKPGGGPGNKGGEGGSGGGRAPKQVPKAQPWDDI